VSLFSVPFAMLVLVGLTLFHACRTLEQRRLVLLALGAAFISVQVESLRNLLPLAAYLAASLVAIRLVDRFKSRALFATSAIGLLGAFLYLKRYVGTWLLPTLPTEFAVIGLSFIVFRVLHVLIDTHQQEGRRDDLEVLPLLNYFTSFLTLTAGPIQRYEDYRAQELAWDRSPSLEPVEWRQAAIRISTGILQFAFLAPVVLGFHQQCIQSADSQTFAFGAASAAYVLYIYFNFAGYMDVMIGVGSLFGFQLPENFHRPYLASNFLDLWNRWHVTLSTWFRDYVFTPVVRTLCATWDSPRALPYFGAIAYFIVFFLLGIWHGSEARYLAVAVLFAVGASANKLFEVEATRRLGPTRYGVLKAHPAYKSLCRALGLSFFTFALSTTWETLTGLRAYADLLASVGVWRALLNVVAVTAAIMVIEWCVLLIQRGAALLGPLVAGTPRRESPAISLGVRLVLVVLLVQSRAAPSEAPAAVPAAEPASKTVTINPLEALYGNY
jgi:alginate O-acetyltransferase complex protein AlgI